jgi:hypothetical protein
MLTDLRGFGGTMFPCLNCHRLPAGRLWGPAAGGGRDPDWHHEQRAGVREAGGAERVYECLGVLGMDPAAAQVSNQHNAAAATWRQSTQ